MEGGTPTVVLSDLEKSVDAKVLTQYLTVTKALPNILKFTSTNDRFLLHFATQKDADAFIWERAFKDQIIARKLNLYSAFFDEQKSRFLTYSIKGVNKDNLRACFQVCWQYSPCKLAIKQQKKLKGTVQFMGEKRENEWKEVAQKLKTLGITLGQTEQSDEDFMCSIQLINYDQTECLQLSEEERLRLQQSLKVFLLKITQKAIKGYEVKVFQHQQSPAVKAYFKYATPQDTFYVFEKLRIYLLDLSPEIKCRLFYFSKEANSFRTLFTTGLQIPENTSQKQFQQRLIEDYRKITPNVMQILLRECGKSYYTGKIYLKDQESGKQLISQYLQKRGFIFRHYRDKNKIMINLFQDKQAINQGKKLEDNAGRMLQHIRHTHQRQKYMTAVVLHENYAQRPQASRKQQRYRQRPQIKVQKQGVKQESKGEVKFVQQQFPSL